MSGVPQVGDGNGSTQQPSLPEDLTQEQLDAIQARMKEAAEKPVFVSELDRVKAELLHIKALVCAYRIKDAQAEVDKANDELRGYQAEIVKSQEEIAAKYEINLQTHEIRADDGLVMPRGQAGMDFGQLMQRLAVSPATPQSS